MPHKHHGVVQVRPPPSPPPRTTLKKQAMKRQQPMDINWEAKKIDTRIELCQRSRQTKRQQLLDIMREAVYKRVWVIAYHPPTVVGSHKHLSPTHPPHTHPLHPQHRTLQWHMTHWSFHTQTDDDFISSLITNSRSILFSLSPSTVRRKCKANKCKDGNPPTKVSKKIDTQKETLTTPMPPFDLMKWIQWMTPIKGRCQRYIIGQNNHFT